jgi:hypothetical protein
VVRARVQYTPYNNDYEFLVNLLSQCDKEWEIYFYYLVYAVLLFYLKDSRPVAKSYIVNR